MGEKHELLIFGYPYCWVDFLTPPNGSLVDDPKHKSPRSWELPLANREPDVIVQSLCGESSVLFQSVSTGIQRPRGKSFTVTQTPSSLDSCDSHAHSKKSLDSCVSKTRRLKPYAWAEQASLGFSLLIPRCISCIACRVCNPHHV